MGDRSPAPPLDLIRVHSMPARPGAGSLPCTPRDEPIGDGDGDASFHLREGGA